MSPDGPFEHLAARSPAARSALDVAARAATSDIPILIEGESGTGKEVLARAVHAASPRRGAPFVAVNCGALPEGLVESILFGHVRGAFTGAVEARPGKFVEADSGTLFLDEVGELALEAQAKLLRALQEREVDPVGAARPRRVDIRVISATNRALAQEARRGAFREDLFYRLAVMSVRMPPLRERRADLPQIAEAILARLARRDGGAARILSPQALALIEAAPWPGNIRQLENALHRATVLSGAGALGPEMFAEFVEQGGAPASALPPAPSRPEDRGAGTHEAFDAQGHVRPLAELEAAHIRLALAHYNGQMSETARRLGLGRSTLYRRIEEMEDARLTEMGREAESADAPVDRRAARP